MPAQIASNAVASNAQSYLANNQALQQKQLDTTREMPISKSASATIAPSLTKFVLASSSTHRSINTLTGGAQPNQQSHIQPIAARPTSLSPYRPMEFDDGVRVDVNPQTGEERLILPLIRKRPKYEASLFVSNLPLLRFLTDFEYRNVLHRHFNKFGCTQKIKIFPNPPASLFTAFVVFEASRAYLFRWTQLTAAFGRPKRMLCVSSTQMRLTSWYCQRLGQRSCPT